MSGFVAIWNLDGRPVDPSLLRRMLDTIAHRGPDGSGEWIRGSVALGHCMLRTTPESLEERQPLTDDTGALCLALDGRVDNRDELKAALRSKAIGLRADTDAELVLKAYEAWGEECPARLLGDFAFVIWDGRNRQLFCARDHIGAKPLYYYYWDGQTFLAASALRPLLGHPAIRPSPNEGMIGEYLANAITSQEETLYQGFLRLPPAHSLAIGPERVRKTRYWQIEPTSTITYRTDGEYAEHFLTLLKEAVRCRLRTHGRVGAYLSGGLDSSTVVGVVQSLIREGLAPDVRFESFSLVFPGLSCDESDYSRAMVKQWDIPSNEVCPEPAPAGYYAELVRDHRDFPDVPNCDMFNGLMQLAHDKGIRVMLTGQGGDHWFAGGEWHYADLLRGLRLRQLFRQLCLSASERAVPSLAAELFNEGVWPLLPFPLRRAIKRVLRRDCPRWIVPEFAHRIRLPERLQANAGKLRLRTAAQTALAQVLILGEESFSMELAERGASRFGLEERHPLHDRRVIEFGLALPEDQRCRGGVMKFMLRQAMRGLLPEQVRERRTKAEFSPFFLPAFDALGGERFFERLSMAAQGWVDGNRLRAMYRRMRELHQAGDGGYKYYTGRLWMIVGVELWFKTFFAEDGRA